METKRKNQRHGNIKCTKRILVFLEFDLLDQVGEIAKTYGISRSYATASLLKQAIAAGFTPDLGDRP